MTREEIKVFLEGQLKKLQKANVADLMKARQHEELEAILENIELDFSPLGEFWKEEDKAIYQSQEEIPKEFLYELTCYIVQSSLGDEVFFEYYEGFIEVLEETEEEVMLDIAGHMMKSDLYKYLIKEVLTTIMTRKKAMMSLESQLKKLQKEHVADLMKTRRYEELEAILEDIELDFSSIEEFWNEKSEAIYQSEEEIPKEFCYELVCYMQQSNLEDEVFIKEEKDFHSVLKETDEEVRKQISEVMSTNHLCYCTMKELIEVA